MNINEYGAVILTKDEVFNALYSGKITDLDEIFLDDTLEIEKFNNSVKKNFDNIGTIKVYQTPAISVQDQDKLNQQQWFMPPDYCPNLVEFLFGQCTTPEQTDRVSKELELFIQHNMFDLLFYLKYLVDTMRENNIVWGVGRGSSVASYCLYLIGVHKVDSIKYGLDIHEFLKEKQNG